MTRYFLRICIEEKTEYYDWITDSMGAGGRRSLSARLGPAFLVYAFNAQLR